MDKFFIIEIGYNEYKLKNKDDSEYENKFKFIEMDNYEKIRSLELVAFNTRRGSKEFIFKEILNDKEYYYNMFPKYFYDLVLYNNIVDGKISINSKIVKRGQRCGLK